MVQMATATFFFCPRPVWNRPKKKKKRIRIGH